MITLSLCMIVKDEAVALPKCLQSVKAVVDEMVVVDTGSSDQTREIAQEFGAKVYDFDWCNDFSAARNHSLKYVQGDWVLVLDADEVLVAGAVPMLKQAIQNRDRLLVNLVRQEVGAKQSPYSLVSRLFRRHPDIYFSQPYHAMVDESVSLILTQEPQWQVSYLPDVAILHRGYQAEAIAGRDKFQKAQAAMEGFLASHPSDPYGCSKLGALYVQTGDLQRGLELLQRGLGSSPENPTLLFELHYHLALAYSRLPDLAQAEIHYQAAAEQPILPKLKLGAYNNWGNLLQAKGNLVGAKLVYQKILQIDPHFAAGYYNLGMTLKAEGNLTAAIAAYQQAITLNPDYAVAYQNLGVALLKVGNPPASLAAFRQAIALHQQQDPTEAERLRQGLKALGFDL